MTLLDIVPAAAASDSIPSLKKELQELSTMSADDIISKLVNGMVNFAVHVAIAILVFYIGKLVINKLYRVVASIMTRRNVDHSLSTFVLSLVRMVLFFILIVTVIGILGIETSSFIAIFASAGVAIGMALSGTLQNFAGGVLILLLKPYKIGDYIEAQGYAGTVTEIQIFSTIICTPDNKSIIIPNGGLSTGSINNWSRERYRRVDWTVGISYGDDVDVARKAILDIVNSDERIIKEEIQPDVHIKGIKSPINPTPVVYVSELGDSSVNLIVRAWCQSNDYWGIYYSINEKIYTDLPKAGVSFPFPQMDVHIDGTVAQSTHKA